MSVNVVMQVPVCLSYDELWPVGNGLISVTKDGLCGLIDDCGHEIIPVIYDYVNQLDNGLIRVLKCGRFGLIDLSGKEVVPCIYEEILEGAINLWAKKGGRFFLIDMKGAPVIDEYFDEVWHEMCGVSAVRKKDKWGVISTRSGKVLVEIAYQKVCFSSSNLIQVQQEEKWGLLWYDGSEILPPVYTSINFESDVEQDEGCKGIGDSEYICVQKDDRWGIIRIYPKEQTL